MPGELLYVWGNIAVDIEQQRTSLKTANISPSNGLKSVSMGDTSYNFGDAGKKQEYSSELINNYINQLNKFRKGLIN